MSTQNICFSWRNKKNSFLFDDELVFNAASSHKGHLHQNGISTWFCKCPKILNTKYLTKSHMQTVQTQIRLLL